MKYNNFFNFFILIGCLILTHLYGIDYGGKRLNDPVDEKYMEVLKDNWYRSKGRPDHGGIDLNAPKGTNVYSVEVGEVVDIRKNPKEIEKELRELNKRLEEATKKKDKITLDDCSKKLDELKKEYSIEDSGYRGYGNVIKIKHKAQDGYTR